MQKEAIVISLGGSVIVQDDIDTSFLKKFKSLISRYKKRYRFVIVTGGGKTSRKYQGAGAKFANVSKDDLDWIGIEASRLNANLVKYILSVKEEIIKDPTRKPDFKDVIVGGGWKPGRSTDFDAVMLAKQLRAKTVINISNVDYLYTKDPRFHKDAKKIENTGWKLLRKIVGNKWTPGMNLIFDPEAVKLGKKLKLKLIFAGKDIGNLEKLLGNKKFKGSVIQ
jgi:uridylate kinase